MFRCGLCERSSILGSLTGSVRMQGHMYRSATLLSTASSTRATTRSNSDDAASLQKQSHQAGVGFASPVSPTHSSLSGEAAVECSCLNSLASVNAPTSVPSPCAQRQWKRLFFLTPVSPTHSSLSDEAAVECPCLNSLASVNAPTSFPSPCAQRQWKRLFFLTSATAM
jgi:hypothetical protein